MFDPRLEQNEEGLFDAPHIELIWMMNTGRFSILYWSIYGQYIGQYMVNKAWMILLLSKISPVSISALY